MKTMKDVGNIKRKYSQEDFNPFLAMEWIYENCLHSGVGNTVLIVGYSKRFINDTIKAWKHVLLSKKLLTTSDEQPKLSCNEFITHTGTILRFEVFSDHESKMMQFSAACKEASIVALFNPYNSPDMKNIIRETVPNSLVYDFSNNNKPEKSIDK